MSSADNPFLRTVLVVMAIWSLGVMLAVESGLGGRWSLHPDAEINTDQLPEVRLVSGVTGVGGFEEYASIVQRPLFSDDRRPPAEEDSAAEQESEQAASVPLNVVVTSIVITGERQIAIVTDPESKRSQTVSVGAALEGDQSSWRLAELQPRRAVFEGPAGRSEVELRVFDGQGGEPPTPLSRSGVARAEGNAGSEAEPKEDPGQPQGTQAVQAESPEARAEQIRRRIEERRRQMREEAERANAERGQ